MGVIFVQVLVSILLCINFIMIKTFSLKDTFYTNMRYMLFANTITSDCINLILTNLLLILTYFKIAISKFLCLFLVIISCLYNFVTPVTLTAMTLERFVAICLPLRHAELCTTYRALQSVLIIHCISFIPCFVFLLFVFFATFESFKQTTVCTAEMFILHSWQGDLRSALSQFYFLIMFIIIAFSYIQIMKVAKVASGENKKSTQKGLRTVLLHGFQLLLCLILLLCPFVEAAVLRIDLYLYKSLRYLNYIIFNLVPRCLNPLIYGLRDEAFLLALKQFMFCNQFNNKVKW
uniref:G-protein coupled receptors family 1 profile domain-containing protein n=1 Tax=Nothobranchius furzeri TaxID=105023 RepID=A0A8C6K810_NOTFU